ncbi:hypothetical protein CFP71_29940 [Amycolatopsis thailandensis]|uniref:Uncharacterized protein n=2 Tax=Amycolatopsis thailandensis TaxID=589330 RepID=A0A229RSC9_9PSEU|nr:hypothetical protein CFP71_29940 [Amycolatopsis thailandensis]
MGLLFGAQMSAKFLTLMDGSDQLLPAMFPGVQHVGRFNLTTTSARNVLVEADKHLGMMAVPYALAIHEDLLRSCIELTGCDVPRDASQLHNKLGSECSKGGGAFNQDSLSQLHTLREMRNAVIHRGGVIDGRVVKRVAAMSNDAVLDWRKVVGRNPLPLVEGATIDLGVGEMFLALAATKVLAKQANEMLARSLPVIRWAEVVVDDFLTHGPQVSTANDRRLRKKLLGWSRFHYHALKISDDEIAAAADARGLKI